MHLNIHYLHSKLDEIKILLSQQVIIDILCLCETFLNDQFRDQELYLNGYKLFRKDRSTNGGSLVVYMKTSLNCKNRENYQKEGIEALLLKVKYENQKPFLLAYTYRPPSSSQRVGTVAQLEACSLGMQAAPSSIPMSGTFFCGDLVMKTFLWPFSLFRWFKKSSCQLLAKECELSTGKLPWRLAQEQCG